MKIVSREEYRNRNSQKDAAEQGTGAAPAAADVVFPDDMARASMALISSLPTNAEERIELRQKRLDAMLAGDLTDDTRKTLGYAAEQLERARYLHAKGAADVDIFPLLENADLRLNSIVWVAAANKTTTKFKSEAGKHAVSHRDDQRAKEPWKDHVKTCVDRGDHIRNIKDLRKGCPPACEGLTDSILKKWAKEAVPSLKFKGGAQKGAVRRRHDPLLEESWKDHVKACWERGDPIRNVGDLLEIKGYPSECSHVALKKLRDWAKEAIPSLKFLQGRTK